MSSQTRPFKRNQKPRMQNAGMSAPKPIDLPSLKKEAVLDTADTNTESTNQSKTWKKDGTKKPTWNTQKNSGRWDDIEEDDADLSQIPIFSNGSNPDPEPLKPTEDETNLKAFDQAMEKLKSAMKSPKKTDYTSKPNIKIVKKTSQDRRQEGAPVAYANVFTPIQAVVYPTAFVAGPPITLPLGVSVRPLGPVMQIPHIPQFTAAVEKIEKKTIKLESGTTINIKKKK